MASRTKESTNDFHNLDRKTGQPGQRGPVKIPDVETLRCNKVSTKNQEVTHSLTNDEEGKTFCEHCGQSWPRLDSTARRKAQEAAANKPPTRKR